MSCSILRMLRHTVLVCFTTIEGRDPSHNRAIVQNDFPNNSAWGLAVLIAVSSFERRSADDSSA